jgi:hypothetical protein
MPAAPESANARWAEIRTGRKGLSSPCQDNEGLTAKPRSPVRIRSSPPLKLSSDGVFRRELARVDCTCWRAHSHQAWLAVAPDRDYATVGSGERGGLTSSHDPRGCESCKSIIVTAR